MSLSEVEISPLVVEGFEVLLGLYLFQAVMIADGSSDTLVVRSTMRAMFWSCCCLM